MTTSPLIGRLLALGLAGLVLLALWAGVAMPLAALYDSRADDLADRQALLARFTRLAEEAPRLKALAAAHHAAPAADASTIAGTTDALAAATLQGLVQQMAGATGATIASVEAVPATQAGPLRRIGLRVRLSGDYQSLVQILIGIRQSTPAMLLDDLSISTGAAGTAGSLDVGFTLYAFRKGDGRA